ncbi:MAG: hypothetical protein V1747_10445 [Candidatus Omnitrophota bacterium]
MQSRFFNGFLAFILPDEVFNYTKKAESAFEPLVSLLLFSSISTALGIKLIHKFAAYEFNLTFSLALLGVLTIFFLFILATAAISGLLDWVYFSGVKIGKKKIKSDFLSSFCCHAYIMPFWLFLLAIYLFLPALEKSSIFVISAVFFMIRLLDMEARLIKAVYGLRLIQSYVLVFLQIILVVLGISMAYFSKDIISCLKGVCPLL